MKRVINNLFISTLVFIGIVICSCSSKKVIENNMVKLIQILKNCSMTILL